MVMGYSLLMVKVIMSKHAGDKINLTQITMKIQKLSSNQAPKMKMSSFTHEIFDQELINPSIFISMNNVECSLKILFVF